VGRSGDGSTRYRSLPPGFSTFGMASHQGGPAEPVVSERETAKRGALVDAIRTGASFPTLGRAPGAGSANGLCRETLCA